MAMKERIKKSFSAAAREYDKRAELQLEAGRELIKRLELFRPEGPILDVGAGTGRLTPREGVCLDIALEMVRLCRGRGRPALCGDGEELPFKEESFGGAISNFALQWTDVKRSFKEVYRVLKRGGLFILSIPVEGSLKSLFRCWREVGSSLPLFNFPREDEVFREFLNLFDVVEFERLELKREFKSPREALRAVTGVGAKNPFGRPKVKEVLRFLELYSKEPVVEYRVLFISGRKV